MASTGILIHHEVWRVPQHEGLCFRVIQAYVMPFHEPYSPLITWRFRGCESMHGAHQENALRSKQDDWRFQVCRNIVHSSNIKPMTDHTFAQRCEIEPVSDWFPNMRDPI
jgi:hypothetical protein